MQAMILAAGLGTRLLPHSAVRPKPLFPILNKPLLPVLVARLKNFGFDHIIVNCHHLRSQIVEALSATEGVVVQEEEILLGTGGGMRKALRHMRDEPLLVVNGDIYHTVNLGEMYRDHCSNEPGITLAMHDYPRFNGVMVNQGRVVGFNNTQNGRQLAFTGLHVVDPVLLENIELDRFSCIIDHYRKLLQAGLDIRCYRVDHCYWTDMGTVGDYLQLHHDLLTGKVDRWAELGEVSHPYCIDGDAKLAERVAMSGWVSVGKAEILGDSLLERVVVWDDVSIPAGIKLVDTIISGDVAGEN
ncbi:nucleotidyltransferase family protein [Desulforhopalus singaporensis]|uniref:Mannose-1-phosphate guanylyltransferase n=1 Tax=Desulforhopalus singaporensis TaxID=91360 RepID=A0A1H0P2A8_9BACT|nr:sugar phosphate nucleotidyltransferase [Desulforhopalus singaporensis]SDO99093.1 mannose-1-phosphate guanylyltransferase [Desulforhopalus singaporensis]